MRTVEKLKMKKLLMTLVLLPLMALANTWTDESTGYTWYYNVSGGKAEIRNSNWCAVSPKPSGALTIPSQINGYPVVGIGSDAFECCTGLTSVTIPSSVTSIGDYAFSDCSGLTSVNIPSGVTSIRSSVFSGCSGLTSVAIPMSVTSIGDDAFRNCSGLTSVTIPSGVTNIGDGAFYGCSGLTSVTIPSSVRNIERFAFSDCSKLTSVIIPSGVTSIGDLAFYNCTGLESVTIPPSVMKIGEGAFSNAGLLSKHEDGLVVVDGCLIDYKGSCYGSVVIPDGVRLIADGVFSWCNLTSVKIPPSVVSIGEEAFFACYYLTSAMIAEGVTSIGSRAFYSCDDLEIVTVPSSVRYIGGEAFYGCRALKSVTIPEGVSCIENSTFSGCSKLGSVTIPSSVTSIGEDAFRGTELMSVHEDGLLLVDGCLIKYKGVCSGSVTIPEGVRLIAGRAFCDCNGLTSVTIPSSVASIGSHAFSGCNDLMAFIVSDGNIAYNSIDGMLYDKFKAELIQCPAAKKGSVTIPSGVATVGEGAFYNCSGLTSVKMPSSVTSIAEGAFRGCSGLTSVTIPACVTRLRDAFPDVAHTIKEVVLCDGTPSVGTDAFLGLNGLTSVTIPLGVTSIGSRAFYGCSGLETLKIPATVMSIGDEAFRDCTGLKSMTIPSSVTSIDRYAFYNCSGLTSLTISSGVASIGYEAFYKCSGLKSVALPKSVTSIGSYAFEGCVGLESITLPFIGTKRGQGDRFSAIFGSSWNVPDTLTAVTLTDEVTIPNYAFEGCEHIRTITLPIGVSSIGDSAFQGCESLSAISLPAGIAKIGSSAFYGCSSLSEVVIPVGVSSIESSTFYDCTSLRKATLPVGLTEIGGSAFRNCRNLYQINIPNTVTSIGFFAFDGCTGLGSGVVVVDKCLLTVNEDCPAAVVIGNDVRMIVGGAFRECENLQSVTINAQIEELPDDFFEYCSNLKKVVLPTSLRVIGGWAFCGCHSLEDIQLPEGLVEIQEGAFNGCASIRSFNIPASVTELWSLPTGWYDDWDEEVFMPSKLTKLTVASGNKVYAAYDNVLYSKDGRILLYCLPSVSSVAIRKGTKFITYGAFQGCTKLTDLTLPEGVVAMGDLWEWLDDDRPSFDFTDGGPLDGCVALRSISLPSTIEYIYMGKPPSLTKLAVAAGNKHYFASDNVLYDKENSQLIYCPPSMKSVKIWEKTESIASYAFEGCAKLESLTIPASVKKIGTSPFWGCEKLKAVYYKGDAPFPLLYEHTCATPWYSWEEVDEEDAADIQDEWKLYVLSSYWPGHCSAEPEYEFLDVTSYVQKGTKWWGDSGEWQGRPLVFVDSIENPVVKYSVSFDPCGGESTVDYVEIESGKAIGMLPTPTRSKYRFNGWYTAAEGGTKISSTTKVTGDVTYYAHWQYDGSATVVVNVGRGCEGMGTVSGGKTAKTGTKVTLKATAKKGYVFTGWYRDAAGEVPVEGGADYRSPSYSYVVGEEDATFYAKFIPVDDDWVSVWCRPQDEYVRGGEIAPLAVEVNSESLATVKVTGLPTGLKFTAKPLTLKATNNRAAVDLPANTIYGTPTKSGIYTATITATTAGKKSETYKVDFVVRGDGEYLVDVMGLDGADYPTNESDMQHAIQWGKMSGYGVFKPDKTATLKATANKGYVFAGWFSEVACVCAGGTEDDGCIYTPAAGSVDYRSTSFPVKVGNEDILYYARFVRAEDDKSIDLVVNGNEVVDDSGAVRVVVKDTATLPTVEIGSVSLPKASVKGLPAGLKWDAKKNCFTGAPTKPGVYKVTFSLKNTTVKKAIVRAFTIEVPNFESPAFPGLKSASDAYPVSVGVAALPAVDAGLAPAYAGYAVKVTGLPSGLAWKSGVLTGLAKKAGDYTVTFTATKGKDKQVSTVTIHVEALPDWAVGTFVGMVRQVDRDERGEIVEDEDGLHDWYDILTTVSVTSAGKVSGKLHFESGTDVSFKSDSISERTDAGYVVRGQLKARGIASDFELLLRKIGIEATGVGDLGAVDVLMRQTSRQEGSSWIECGETTFSTDEDAPLRQNVWSSKKLPLPPSVNGVKKVVEHKDDVYTLTFGKNGSVKVSLAKADKPTKAIASGSATLSIVEYVSGEWNCELCTSVVVKKNDYGAVRIFDVTISADGAVICLPQK